MNEQRARHDSTAPDRRSHPARVVLVARLDVRRPSRAAESAQGGTSARGGWTCGALAETASRLAAAMRVARRAGVDRESHRRRCGTEWGSVRGGSGLKSRSFRTMHPPTQKRDHGHRRPAPVGRKNARQRKRSSRVLLVLKFGNKTPPRPPQCAPRASGGRRAREATSGRCRGRVGACVAQARSQRVGGTVTGQVTDCQILAVARICRRRGKKRVTR